MCGFAVQFCYHDAALTTARDALVGASRAMLRRGPDDHGEWHSACGRFSAVHRRLAIIDPSENGHQPMRDEERDLSLVFNGEIYNYRELRDALVERGHRFTSSSDTEVVLAMYREHGEQMLPMLRGMFAFALWDGRREALLLARDGYGIKPLYLADDGWSVRVASQARVLAAMDGVDARSDPAGWAGFFVFGSVPEPFTVYRGVSAVPAGTLLVIDRTGVRAPVRWFSLAESLHDARDRSPDAARIGDPHDVGGAFRDSVAAHLVADVPVGLFLSAGVDSASVLALSQELGARDLQTVTVGFDEFRGQARDEVPGAAELARRYRVRHHVRRVSADEFRADADAMRQSMDQPSIDGVNTWFAAKAMRELGLKVALSGVGGDELLGGYPSFRQVPRLARAGRVACVLPGLGGLSRLVLAPLVAGLGASPKWAGIIDYASSLERAYVLRRALFMPFELDDLMGRDAAREGLRRLMPGARLRSLLEPRPARDFCRLLVLESGCYLRNQLLRDCDWAGMAHSVEVRTPLVDTRLLRRLSPWLLGRRRAPGKRVLAHAPRRALPARALERAKTGFEVPLASWLDRAAGDVRRAGGAGTRTWALSVAEGFA